MTDGARSSRRPGTAVDAAAFGDVVEALCSANDELLSGFRAERSRHPLPSRDAIGRIVEDLRTVLFPGHFGSMDVEPQRMRYHVGARLEDARVALAEQVRRGLVFACEHGFGPTPPSPD